MPRKALHQLLIPGTEPATEATEVTEKPAIDWARKGRGSKKKGKAYECWVANELKPIYPDAKRGIGQARSSFEVPDVDGTPFWVEAKHRIRANIRAAYEQGMRERAQHPSRQRSPVLVVSRDNGKPDLATVDLATFKGLLAELEMLRRAFDKETGEE